jgi:hypothetical protein
MEKAPAQGGSAGAGPEGGDQPLRARIVRAAWAGETAAMCEAMTELAKLVDQGRPGAAKELEDAAIELAKAHLLDDVRRSLPRETDQHLTEVVRARCSPTVRAAWKLAAYDVPNLTPGAEPPPPAGHPLLERPPQK